MRILVTRKNRPYIAAGLGIPDGELMDKIHEAEFAFKKRQDMAYILSFFNADEKWYEETKDKIAQIASTLPQGMDHRERTIRMYGWIEKETIIFESLDLPLESDRVYSAAHAIEMVFTGDIDAYHRIMNLD